MARLAAVTIADDQRVGVGLAAIRLDPVGDLLEPGDALRPPWVAADHVTGAGRQHRFETVEVPLLLAVGDERLRLGPQRRIALRIPRAERLFDPRDVEVVERLHSLDRRGNVPLDGDAQIDDQLLVGSDALAHRPDVLDVAIMLVTEPRVAPLAEADLDPVQPIGEPALSLGDHLRDRFEVGVRRGDRRESIVDRSAEQIAHAAPEGLALEVPHGDVDRRDGVRCQPAAVAVPPGAVLESAPDDFGLHRILADDELVEAIDQGGDGRVGLGELGDCLTPPDGAVVGGQLDQAQVTRGIEVVGLGIGDRDGLHRGDAHRAPCPAIGLQPIPETLLATTVKRQLRCAGEATLGRTRR